MVIIYSEKVENIYGAYIAPRYFDENNLEKATKVYASDKKILEAYKNAGVEVEDISKPKKAKGE